MADDPHIPDSRLGRLTRLAGLGVRAGTGKLAGLLGRERAEEEVVRSVRETLGQLRGLALKMGQMASYLDGLVPEQHRELYEQGLRSLRDAAPAMSPAAAARVVREELGADPRELFAQWEEQPLASASIGQVHRARLHDGRTVAVKVQHENVQSAVRADLDNASLFTSLLGPLGGRFAVKQQVAELRARFLEELDYRHEAAAQRAFRAMFQGHPHIRIPEVIEDRLGTRVLTSEFAEGVRFEEACARSEDERRAWAETLWSFVFGSLLRAGRFNADPHPGNYLFAPEGAVWFLDFGCTRDHSPAKHQLVQRLHRAVLGDQDAQVSRLLPELFEMPSGGEQAQKANDFMRLCFEPMLERRPYRITRAHVERLMAEMRANVTALARAPRGTYAPLPAEFLFFNRLQFGFFSVLARLDVAVDYRSLHERLLASAGP
jgi:predicted unusual protein kinase regulating ubiquinone biosynthesis (AarF/ABC1/UbiB family)